MRKVQIAQSWQAVLQPYFDQPYFDQLAAFVSQAYKEKKIYPAPGLIFKAFNETAWDKTKVVIVGQDPYHGHGQADGLAFSVPRGFRIPPSLSNIFRERLADLGKPIPTSGDLTHWAKQGVLLINRVLTVEAGQPASHQGKGWEQFTAQVIKLLSKRKKGLVFILWGRQAQQLATYIDHEQHLIVQSAHPSPFSVHRGFKGSKPFSKTNAYLKAQGKEVIDW